MIQVTWPRWPPCSKLLKTFKNLLLQSRWTDFYKTWYVASGTPVHHSLYKWWPWVDLDIIYGKVKFGYIGFSIGKSENNGFFRKYSSLWPENWYMQTTNWVNEGKWVLKVKVISWPWPKVIYIWKLKPALLRYHWAILNQILSVSFQLQGNENPWSLCWSHDQDGRHALIWKKTLQKSSSPEPVDRFPRNLVCSRFGTPAHHSLFKWWPWVDLVLF